MKVEFSGTYLGTTWANIIWTMLSPTTIPAVADQDAVAEAIQDVFYSEIINEFCSPNCHFNTTRTTVYLAGSQKQRRVYVEDAVGGAGGSDLPAQVSAVVDFTSLDGRRGGKPRLYVPGLSSTVVTESWQLAASLLATLNGHIGTFISGVNASAAGAITSVELVEMSFVEAGAYRHPPIFWPITGGYLRTVLGTQRRRVDRQA